MLWYIFSLHIGRLTFNSVFPFVNSTACSLYYHQVSYDIKIKKWVSTDAKGVYFIVYECEHSIPIQNFIFRFVDGFSQKFYLLFSRLHLSIYTDKIKTLDLFRIVWYYCVRYVYVILLKINHHAEELKMLLRFDFTILKLQKDGEWKKSREKKKTQPQILKESNCGNKMRNDVVISLIKYLEIALLAMKDFDCFGYIDTIGDFVCNGPSQHKTTTPEPWVQWSNEIFSKQLNKRTNWLRSQRVYIKTGMGNVLLID